MIIHAYIHGVYIVRIRIFGVYDSGGGRVLEFELDKILSPLVLVQICGVTRIFERRSVRQAINGGSAVTWSSC